MTEPLSAALVGAKILDILLGQAISRGVDGLSGGASKALKDARYELDKETKERAARMTLIVQKAAEELQPALEQIKIDTGQDHSALFQHPPFLAQVAQALLTNLTLDVDAFRAGYQAKFSDGKWADLAEPLDMFFSQLKLLLARDPQWGPALREFRREAQQAGLNASALQLVVTAERIAKTLDSQPERTGEAVARHLHPLDLGILEKAYLTQVARQCNRLSLAGDAIDPAAQGLPRLQSVYVDLDTNQWPTLEQVIRRMRLSPPKASQLDRILRQSMAKGLAEREWDGCLTADLAQRLLQTLGDPAQLRSSGLEEQLKSLGIAPDQLSAAVRRISVLDAIAQHKKLVILGHPGSGKSTFTQRVAGLLAMQANHDLLSQDREWQAVLEAIYGRWLLPVRIVLNHWADHLPDDAEGTPSDLIREALRVIKQTVGDVAEERLKEQFLARILVDQPTVLLLLDGLDEVTDEDKRRLIVKSIRSFSEGNEGYGKVPLLVTCRVLPYTSGESYRLPLEKVELGKLARPSIENFIQRWHDALIEADISDEKTARSKQEQLSSAIWNPRQSELSDMAGTPLLLTMMAIVNREGGLPDTRAELYDRCTRQLLYAWEKLKQDGSGRETSLISLLDSVGIRPSNLEAALDQLAFDIHGSEGGRNTVKIPDDLLCSRLRDLYLGFHPRDEGKAAEWAVNLRTLIDKRSGLLNAKYEAKTYEFAHRTFQEFLAARYMANDIGRFVEKIDDVDWQEVVLLAFGYQIYCQNNANQSVMTLDALLPRKLDNAQQRRRIVLVGEGYVNLLKPGGARQSSLTEKREALETDIPKMLQLAMRTARLKDEAKADGRQIARQRLDAGLLLADLDPAEPAMDDFVDIPGLGQIGRYPVTNREFKRFMDDGGYQQDKPWWSEAALKEIPQYYGEWPDAPRFRDDSRFNHPSQPVVGVSWYEAVAYCAWLTGRMQADGRDGEARLPTLEEWRQVAGSRTYPWGPTFDPARANSKESGLNQTTPVDMYPDGATPDRIWDMAGNVWEWTNTDDGGTKNLFYYLGGGVWYNNASGVGSAARFRGYPGDRLVDNGFRVLVVPVSRSG